MKVAVKAAFLYWPFPVVAQLAVGVSPLALERLVCLREVLRQDWRLLVLEGACSWECWSQLRGQDGGRATASLLNLV